MRQEAKEVDGPELERAEERKRESELVEEDEEELHDLDGQPESMRKDERSGAVITAMAAILDGEHIVINDLKMPQRELRALEALKSAVDGRDAQRNQFVFAEDRRALLEQALAVLQPDLTGMAGQPIEALMKGVAGVREQLNVLEDSEDMIEKKPQADEKGEAGDTDDKPKPDDDTSLTGPERKVAKPASSLAGAERKPEPKPASSLAGPERNEAKSASSLAGPERKAEPKPASSLGGPEIKEAPKPATTLGDAGEIAETAKKKPWWKRPFGG